MKRNNIRVLLFAMVCVLLINNCSGVAFAASSEMMRSSPTLNAYSAILRESSIKGTIKISYDVAANKNAESLGVSSIKIYKADGSYVTTIYGTTQNGLIVSQDFRHISSYPYTGTSGTSYYAEVTVFATIDGVTDSRTVTTNTVKAP